MLLEQMLVVASLCNPPTRRQAHLHFTVVAEEVIEPARQMLFAGKLQSIGPAMSRVLLTYRSHPLGTIKYVFVTGHFRSARDLLRAIEAAVPERNCPAIG